MCNANNFISSVQTSGIRIRIRITKYSFKKALNKKICWNHFYQGKRQNMFFFVLIIHFRQFGAEKHEKKFSQFFFQNFFESCSKSSEMWKKNKKIIFSLCPQIRIQMKIFARIWIQIQGQNFSRDTPDLPPTWSGSKKSGGIELACVSSMS